MDIRTKIKEIKKNCNKNCEECNYSYDTRCHKHCIFETIATNDVVNKKDFKTQEGEKIYSICKGICTTEQRCKDCILFTNNKICLCDFR